MGLWNGKVIADIKLRPPHDDFEAVTLCEKECNTRDGECTGVSYCARARKFFFWIIALP